MAIEAKPTKLGYRRKPEEIEVRRHGLTRQASRMGVCAVLVVGALSAGDPDRSATEEKSTSQYPLGLELQVLARDLTSKEYLAVLETMIPTDLAAEWLRIGTPDNADAFVAAHGGREAVLADPELKAAYEERRRIVDEFLTLMRAACTKRKIEPPFNDDTVRELLESAGRPPQAGEADLSVPVRVIMPAAGAERQWPRFRGPTGQGQAAGGDFPLTWSESENIAWKVELPGKGNSSPVVWNDRIFVTSATDDGAERMLLCYARADGRELWKKAAQPPKELEKLYWKNTYASSTPVTDGTRVVVFFGASGLHCFDFDGNLLWQKDLGPIVTGHGPGTSPLIYKNMAIVVQYQNQGDSVFVAFDLATGNERWRRKPENQMCWSTPVVLRVGDHDELVYNGSLRVVGYAPDTGEEIWSVSGSSREAVPTIVVGGGLIFSTTGRNGPTMAIRPGGQGDITATHVFWQTPRGGSHVPSPAYHDGRLFLINDTGIATCLDAKSGKPVWQKRLEGRFSMSPVVSGNKIILTNEQGKTFVLKAADQFELLAENDLDEGTLATPAVLDGRIYFRTAEHLLCIGSSGDATSSSEQETLKAETADQRP
jgi:outer membrane protein assembly factor BamB